MLQLQCCSVESSDDFKLAVEFIRYTNEANEGKVVPKVRKRQGFTSSILSVNAAKRYLMCFEVNDFTFGTFITDVFLSSHHVRLRRGKAQTVLQVHGQQKVDLVKTHHDVQRC